MIEQAEQPTLFELPESNVVGPSCPLWPWKRACPHCGEAVGDRNFGSDILLGRPPRKSYGLFGEVVLIKSWRFGNCFNCWGAVELINMRIAHSVLMPAAYGRLAERKLAEEQNG
jgi:hypothetical protein